GAGSCTTPAPNADHEDFFNVNQLQRMFDAALNSNPGAPLPNGDNPAGHTLTLDGQAGTDTYVVNTTGSQGGLDQKQIPGAPCHNYVINALDTGSPDDGADVLIVNGYDNPQVGYDSLGHLTAGDGYDSNGNPYPTDDIFLLRGMNFIGSTPTSSN